MRQVRDYVKIDAVINKKFALDFVPNLAKQNLDNIRIIEREINDELLEKTYLPKRYSVKVVSYKKDVDGKHEISGYKDKVTSVYGFGDHYLGHNMRGGYGLNVTRSDSDFDNDSSRYNNVVEAFAPVLWNKEDTSALVKLKAGFGRGHYRRRLRHCGQGREERGARGQEERDQSRTDQTRDAVALPGKSFQKSSGNRESHHFHRAQHGTDGGRHQAFRERQRSGGSLHQDRRHDHGPRRSI